MQLKASKSLTVSIKKAEENYVNWEDIKEKLSRRYGRWNISYEKLQVQEFRGNDEK